MGENDAGFFCGHGQRFEDHDQEKLTSLLDRLGYV